MTGDRAHELHRLPGYGGERGRSLTVHLAAHETGLDAENVARPRVAMLQKHYAAFRA
jgi:hypothetical protein